MKAVLVAMRENLAWIGLVITCVSAILTVILAEIHPETNGPAISFLVTAFGGALLLLGALHPRFRSPSRPLDV
jgi:hypothetical protein